jgi:NAD(P)-dependent dehydrogenase (short-subunit alcohol dehydrogenase family)
MTNSEMVQGIDLTGQVAIVTGGGRGIGRAIALALAEAGAEVGVVSRTESELGETVRLIEEAGGGAAAYPADVTDRVAVERVVNDVEEDLGPIDLLINGAGQWLLFGPIWEADADEWWREVEVNLRGPFLFTRTVLPGMLARGQGRIINIASEGGIVSFPYLSAYVAGKTALIRLSETVAAETKQHGISVFSIHPGGVRTRMQEYWLDPATAPPPPAYDLWAWHYKAFEDGLNVPVEQPVQLMLYLASGKADALSGCYMCVNDDVRDMAARVEDIQREQLYTLQLRA